MPTTLLIAPSPEFSDLPTALCVQEHVSFNPTIYQLSIDDTSSTLKSANKALVLTPKTREFKGISLIPKPSDSKSFL